MVPKVSTVACASEPSATEAANAAAHALGGANVSLTRPLARNQISNSASAITGAASGRRIALIDAVMRADPA